MPVNRPGKAYYATNDTGGTIKHGDPVIFDNIPGIAVKQKVVSWTEGLAAQALIQDSEDFLIIDKGVVQIPIEGGYAKGDALYIAAASTTSGVTTFDVTETAGGNTPFGRVVEVPGDGRGVPTGFCRVDLDAKDLI